MNLMSTQRNYVLPENVRFTPVAELPETLKAKFEYEEGDVLLTFDHSRQTSKVIDADVADLLREFTTPKPLVEGIFRYAVLHKLKAQEVLDHSFMMLAQLRGEGFLVDAEGDLSHRSQQDFFSAGDMFLDYEVAAKIQSISDTEVYKIKKGEVYYVLKLLKTSGHEKYVMLNYEKEVAILSHLEGVCTPALLDSGEWEGNHYIIMQWCEGAACDEATEKYRNLTDPDNLYRLISIFYKILEAYAFIHSKGVIHSDIHPRNVLVADDGGVKIIDFGISRFENVSENTARGGVGFFFEPEYALSVINRKVQPPASFLGEQYALSALLYQLLTGKPYLDFSFEKEVAFKQIAENPPVPFSQYDLDIDPEIEAVIFKGLSKAPADRFSSVREYADRFLAIRKRMEQQKSTIPEIKYSVAAFMEALERRLGWDGPLLDHGLQLPPTCSVNYGAAGIAYLFYRLACLRNDPDMLALADVWVNRAQACLKDEDRAFFSKEIEITPETVGHTSIYHSAAGVHLVQALVCKAMGDINGCYHAILGFVAEASRPCEDLDVTVGLSSNLIGCAVLWELFQHEETLKQEIARLAAQTRDKIWNIIDAYPPVADGSPILYRGIAHGWAGILYATLLWSRQSGTALPSPFFRRVKELEDLGIEENGYVRWNLTPDSTESWPGWCHGAAGYAFLWMLLFRCTAERRYLDLAHKSAKYFIENDQEDTNGSLCCGMSGQAYALLSIYRATRDEFYLKTAKNLARRIVKNAYSPLMRNNSLYKGDVGAAVLFAELDQPLSARMPLFEVL